MMVRVRAVRVRVRGVRVRAKVGRVTSMHTDNCHYVTWSAAPRRHCLAG